MYRIRNVYWNILESVGRMVVWILASGGAKSLGITEVNEIKIIMGFMIIWCFLPLIKNIVKVEEFEEIKEIIGEEDEDNMPKVQKVHSRRRKRNRKL